MKVELRVELDSFLLMFSQDDVKYFLVLLLLVAQVWPPRYKVLVAARCRLFVYDVPGGNLSLCFSWFGVSIADIIV